MCVYDIVSLKQLKRKKSYPIAIWGVSTFITIILLFPIALFTTMILPRQEKIKMLTTAILNHYYDVKNTS